MEVGLPNARFAVLLSLCYTPTSMEKQKTIATDPMIEAMFHAGAHFAFSKSRRHPSTKPYIYGAKNRVEIFNLEKTKGTLESALQFISKLGEAKKTVLFVGGKPEARAALKIAAESLQMPYVASRWIGGTLTNFTEIKKRIDTFLDLVSKRDKGELSKYTKKERLMIDRKIANLESMFLGIVTLKEQPAALIVIDPRHESIAVEEAKKRKIPIVALLGSDCNLKDVTYPIVGNDASRSSIDFFVKEIVKAYTTRS